MSAVDWARRLRWLLAKKERCEIEIDNCNQLIEILRQKLANEYKLPPLTPISTVLNNHDHARLRAGDNITGF